MNTKKILFVCQFFYPEKVSSAVLPFELASELANQGYEVEALVGYPKEYHNDEAVPLKETINNIKIKRVKYLTMKRNNILGRLLNYLSFCSTILFHFNNFRNVKICISYTNPPFLPPIIAFFSKIFKFKFYFEIYDLYPDTAIKANYMREDSFICSIFKNATNYALKNANTVIVLSNECEVYLKNNKSINLNNIKVIPNWYKEQVPIKQFYPKNKMKILYGGNMGIMQDIDTILNTILYLKDSDKFEFIFAGHGNKKEDIHSFIKKNNLKNVVLYDFLPKIEYDNLMNDIDMAIVSLELFGVGLGSPSKYYGYLAKEIPVIGIIDSTTDIAKDILYYNNGIHVKNGDYIYLVEKLLDLYDNQDKLYRMRQHSSKLFKEKYVLKKVIKQYLELLEV